MLNYKNFAPWLILLAFIFSSAELFSNENETVSGINRASSIESSRTGDLSADQRNRLDTGARETSGQTTREGISNPESVEGVSGTRAVQSNLSQKNNSFNPQNLTPEMLKNLVYGQFYLTPSEIGAPNPFVNTIEEGITYLGGDLNNPAYTQRGTLIKKDNFFGSDFEIFIDGRTLIPVDLRPNFQIDGLEVVVCYQPVAYTANGAGPTMISVLGMKAIKYGNVSVYSDEN